MSNEIKGISHIYNETTGQSSVTWSYKDNPELEHFVLEYYDDIKKKWVPYDEHMGIVRKGDTATATPITSDGGTAGGGIPPGAVFTDTITSINDKTGVITKEDIMALGIPGQDTLYTLPVAGSILGGVKSGGDITISSEGVVEVKDNSHKHTIADITDLEDFTGGPQKYSTTIGSTKTVIVNHNLASRDLIVSLRETASPYSQIYTTIEFTTINSLLVEFKETPAANEYTITIIG